MSKVSIDEIEQLINTAIAMSVRKKDTSVGDVIAAKAALELERQNDLLAEIAESKAKVAETHEVQVSINAIAFKQQLTEAMNRVIEQSNIARTKKDDRNG